MHAQYVKEYMQKREASPPGTVLTTKVLNHVRNLMAVDVTGEKFPISLRYAEAPSVCSVSVCSGIAELSCLVRLYGGGVSYAVPAALAVRHRCSLLLCFSVALHSLRYHHSVTERASATPGAPPTFLGLLQVVDQETEAWATIDASGIVLAVNDGFTTLCGFSRDDLVGKNISIIIPPPHAAQHDGYLQRCGEGLGWIYELFFVVVLCCVMQASVVCRALRCCVCSVFVVYAS